MNIGITIQQLDFRQFVKNQIKIKGFKTSCVVVFFHPDGAACVDNQNFSFHGLNFVKNNGI